MKTEKKIAIVGPQSEQTSRLLTVLNFMGEEVEFISASVATNQNEHTRYKAMFLVVDAVTEIIFQSLAVKLYWQPMIIFGNMITTYPNVLGKVEEPFNYTQVGELIDACSCYAKEKQSYTQSVNQQTKLFRSLVGSSPSIIHVRDLVHQAANTDSAVLVLGPVGTGKEVVARNIHYFSRKIKGQFIPMSCGSIPSELFESELFGQEKNAADGSKSIRKGRLELADNGTLFLTDISAMPQFTQFKLYDALIKKSFVRVGGSENISFNARVVATTDRDLSYMANYGEFDLKLYEYLNQFPILLPPLNERKEDLSLLIQELITRLCREENHKISFDSDAIETLKVYDWPQNIRELSNLVEQLIILCPGELITNEKLPAKYQTETSDLINKNSDPTSYQAPLSNFDNDVIGSEPERLLNKDLPEEGINLKDLLAEIEIDMIRQALEKENYVVARAAELLGFRRTTLVEKMRKYGMNKD